MSNIDNIIADIKEVQMTHDFWIRDENGNLKDGVICGEVIPFLEELKEYEVEMSQADIEDMINLWDNNPDVDHIWRNGNKYLKDNTYNYNANIDHNIEYRIRKTVDDGIWFAFMVHRHGDVRGNYTDWAVCTFDYAEKFLELESVMQCKNITDKYVANINIFSETYDVHDVETGETMYGFYDSEVKDLLISIDKYRKDD